MSVMISPVRSALSRRGLGCGKGRHIDPENENHTNEKHNDQPNLQKKLGYSVDPFPICEKSNHTRIVSPR